MLKVARNLVADAAAVTADAVPPTEPMFRLVGRAIDPIPGVRTLYRRAIDTLVGRWIANDRQYRTLQIGDVAFEFDVSDFTARPWFFHRRLFEPQTTQYLLQTLQPGWTVFDIGANRGYVTLIAAQKVGPAGRVHSFEPNPQVLSELRSHVKRNGLTDRVLVSAEALSDRCDEQVTFFVSTLESNTGLSSLTPAADLLERQTLSAEHTISVKTITLDEYVRSQGLTSAIDLIKIDVEGAELLVLRGAEQTLRTMPPKRWIVETEPGSEACRLLSGYGYREEHFDAAGDKVNAVFTHGSLN